LFDSVAEFVAVTRLLIDHKRLFDAGSPDEPLPLLAWLNGCAVTTG
jgi:hypothetical protein